MLGIDIGSNYIRVAGGDSGLICEPSVVATDRQGRLVALGHEAAPLLGRAPPNLDVRQPIRNGVLADYALGEQLLSHLILSSCKGFGRFIKPHVSLCIPSGVTDVQRRAFTSAAKSVGAKTIRVVEQPLASALGAGLDISPPEGKFAINIGGGTSDMAILSMNEVVMSASVPVAGEAFDHAIQEHLKRCYRMGVGERTAERVKLELGAIGYHISCQPKTLSIHGRDLVSGMPKQLELSRAEIVQVLAEPFSKIIDCAKNLLALAPPELISDIKADGGILTGGSALMPGLKEELGEKLNLDLTIADQPADCAVLGAVALPKGR